MKELKRIPSFKTDEEAEHFFDTADLSGYDFSDFVPMQFKFEASGNPRVGESFDDFLRDEGILDDVTATALARRIGKAPNRNG